MRCAMSWSSDGDLELVPGDLVPTQAGVDELVDGRLGSPVGDVDVVGEAEVLGEAGQHRSPVLEQVGVADEGPRPAPGLPLADQRGVDPAGRR